MCTVQMYIHVVHIHIHFIVNFNVFEVVMQYMKYSIVQYNYLLPRKSLGMYAHSLFCTVAFLFW